MEIYSKERKDAVLLSGNYKGYDFVIRTLGHWPCAYVGVYNPPVIDIDELEVPVCFTYKSWEFAHLPFLREGLNWFGWDYGHSNDYHPLFKTDGHKYTMDEIMSDVRKVIDAYIEKTTATQMKNM